jgi:lipoprotein-releasing system permease protein
MKLWLARQRYLIDFTLASLARRKTRNLGLLAVSTLLVFMLASVTLYSHALRQEAARVLANSPEVIVQRMVAGRHDLIPPGYLEKIGRIRGVQRREARLWGYYYDAVTKRQLHLHGAGGKRAGRRRDRGRPGAGAFARAGQTQRHFLSFVFRQAA